MVLIQSFSSPSLYLKRANLQGRTWYIIPVLKKGDLSKTHNYRGISLTCITAKMMNQMIRCRTKSKTDLWLSDSQSGFRQKLTTVVQILALRWVIEETWRNNFTAALCFNDFKKAFDAIYRGKMMSILKAYDIPPELVQAIQTCTAIHMQV